MKSADAIIAWQESLPDATNHFMDIRPCKIPSTYGETEIAILEKLKAETVYRLNGNVTQVSVCIIVTEGFDS